MIARPRPSPTFHYKSDKTSTSQFGLIVEEVAAVNPDLVVRDEKGEVYTVRYDAVNAMLLNEFSQRAPQSAGAGSDDCTAEKRDGNNCCSSQRARFKNPKSERTNRAQ